MAIANIECQIEVKADSRAIEGSANAYLATVSKSGVVLTAGLPNSDKLFALMLRDRGSNPLDFPALLLAVGSANVGSPVDQRYQSFEVPAEADGEVLGSLINDALESLTGTVTGISIDQKSHTRLVVSVWNDAGGASTVYDSRVFMANADGSNEKTAEEIRAFIAGATSLANIAICSVGDRVLILVVVVQ
jgi:hypothetical protein